MNQFKEYDYVKHFKHETLTEKEQIKIEKNLFDIKRFLVGKFPTFRHVFLTNQQFRYVHS